MSRSNKTAGWRSRAVLPLIFAAALVGVAVPARGADENSAPAEESRLSKATVLAHSGHFDRVSDVREIEALFIETKNPAVRVLAAYLLTYAPAAILKAPVGDYLEFLLGHAHTEATVGRPAMLRLRRLRADAAYENGNFTAAIADYEQMRKLSEKNQSDSLAAYATLKLGWCYLNLKGPQDAFRLWISTIQNDPASVSTALSPTLLQGLGQALGENSRRTAEDFEALNRLEWGEEARQSFIAGTLEGLRSLSPAGRDHFAEQARRLTYWPEWIRAVFARSRPTDDQACHWLGWLGESSGESKDEGPLPYDPFGPVVESCRRSLSAARPIVRHVALLSAVLPRLELHGVQRRFRFEWYRARAPKLACLEGLDWAAEHSRASDPEIFPVSETTRICGRVIDPEIATRVAQRIEAEAKSPFHGNVNSQLASGEGQPLLFLLVSLLSSADLKKILLEKVQREPDAFRATSVPTVLAERLYRDRDADSAYALSLAVGPSDSSGGTSAGIWQDVFSAKLHRWLEDGKIEEARSALQSKFPLERAAEFSPSAIRSWVVALTAWPTTPAEKDFVQNSSTALTPALPKAEPDVRDAYLAWMSKDRSLDLKATLAKLPTPLGLPADLDDRISRTLFADAYARHETADAALARHPGLNFADALGTALAEGDVPRALRLEPAGKSAVSEDARYLRRLQKTAAETLTRAQKKNLLGQIPLWAGFLKNQVTRLRGRPWSHEALFTAAQTLVGDFCRRAHGQLDASVKRGTKPEWGPMLSTLDTRLNDCQHREPAASEKGTNSEATP